MDAPWRVMRMTIQNEYKLRYFSKIVNSTAENRSERDFKKFLVEMDMPVDDGFTCLKSMCTVCSVKRAGNLYINKTTGFFSCVKCRSYGEYEALHKFLSKCKGILKRDISELKSPLNGIKSFPKELILKEALAPVCGFSKEETVRLLQQFGVPINYSDLPVVQKILKDVKVCIDSSASHLYFPLRSLDNVTAGFKMIAKNSFEETTVVGAEQSGLLILKSDRQTATQSTKEIKSAVVVMSVKDALALALAKPSIKSDVICLPHGFHNLPIEILPMFEKYNKITFWFQNCSGTWDAIRCFSTKLNAKRCYAVKPSSLYPSVVAVYENKQNLAKLLSEARPLHIESVTDFKSLRAEVMFELMNIGKVEGIKWRSFPQLNNLLKGFRRGELTIFSGSTGSGKTTLMSQYSLDLAEQGVNTLWGSFEIPNHRLARTLLTQLAGMPLQENMDRFDDFADKLERIPLYFMKFHGEHSLEKVMKVIEHAQYVYDVGHVIIDTVQFMMGVSEDSCGADRFWRQDNIIAAFRSFATHCNCHVTLVIHPRKEREGDHLLLSSVFGGAKATQEADNVLMLQNYRNDNGGLFLKVLKNRFCGEVGKVPLEFDKSSLRFTQAKTFSFEATTRENKDNNSWNELNVLG